MFRNTKIRLVMKQKICCDFPATKDLDKTTGLKIYFWETSEWPQKQELSILNISCYIDTAKHDSRLWLPALNGLDHFSSCWQWFCGDVSSGNRNAIGVCLSDKLIFFHISTIMFLLGQHLVFTLCTFSNEDVEVYLGIFKTFYRILWEIFHQDASNSYFGKK